MPVKLVEDVSIHISNSISNSLTVKFQILETMVAIKQFNIFSILLFISTLMNYSLLYKLLLRLLRV